MPNLLLSRACEQRLQTGLPLTGAFQLESVTRLSSAIADLGCCLEQMTMAEQIGVLQDQLAAMHEHLCDLMNQAAIKYEQVTA